MHDEGSFPYAAGRAVGDQPFLPGSASPSLLIASARRKGLHCFSARSHVNATASSFYRDSGIYSFEQVFALTVDIGPNCGTCDATASETSRTGPWPDA